MGDHEGGVLRVPARRNQVVLVVPRCLDAVTAARRQLVAAAREAGVGEVDGLRAVASELVANAIVHGGGEPIVRLTLEPRSLLVEVADEAPRGLTFFGASDDAGWGMGLRIVDAVAEEWGMVPETSHKVVWARVRRDEGGPRR